MSRTRFRRTIGCTGDLGAVGSEFKILTSVPVYPGRYPHMQMPKFFETDQDEYLFDGVTYVDYFNLYPNLRFTPTLDHLATVDDIAVLKTANDSEGWQIAANFCNFNFLLDTHFHGTSTMFCAEKSVADKTVMLAFLGCFLPTIRDHWPVSDKIVTKNANWLSKLLRLSPWR